MTNETIHKFKYPDTLIREYPRWVVLLRPAQVTIGSLVLASKESALRFPDLSNEAFAELKEVAGHLEEALSSAFRYDKINYLMLMMVDRHVHYHVIPRYSAAVTINGRAHADAGWPGPPDVTGAIDLSGSDFSTVQEMVRAGWPV